MKKKRLYDIHFRTLLKRLGLLLMVYMLLRILFYLFNFSAFQDASFLDTISAFIYGLRFDLSAVFALNSPFILLSLLPFRFIYKHSYQQFLKAFFFLVNVPFLVLNVADLEFFKYIGRRSSNEIFTITKDIIEQSGQLLQHYWFLALPAVLVFLLLLRIYPRLPESKPRKKQWQRLLVLLLMGIAAVVFIRGGFQFKPLRTSHAFIFEEASLGHLSLNSSFTFIKGVGSEKLELKNYFETEEELLQALQFNPYKYKNQPQPVQKENVVIIILESFSTEYTGIANEYKGYTPFFDSLAAQGLFFPNNFANGRKSIEAMPSVLAGLPALMPEPYITSNYQTNTLHGLGNILQKEGYHTSFFHGATNGSMGFNNFSKLIGFEEYYGLNQYPNDNDHYDGQWGIFDEPYLNYFARTLTTQPQPFLSAVFTLSSHQPYTIPAQHKGRFPKGELEIHETIGYADYALQQFFKEAAKQPWFSNTLFILTADHTQMSNQEEYNNLLGPYRVPLLFYHPGKKFPSQISNRITQQADVLPSVVDFLNIKTTSVKPFGHSVLDTTEAGLALFFTENYYTLVQQNLITQISTDNEVRYLPNPLSEGATDGPAEKAAAEKQLKAYIQYFNNGLIENKLYFWKKK